MVSVVFDGVLIIDTLVFSLPALSLPKFTHKPIIRPNAIPKIAPPRKYLFIVSLPFVRCFGTYSACDYRALCLSRIGNELANC